MTYTDPALIAAALKRELKDTEQLALSVFIPAIQRWLDKKLGTTFLPEAAATNRYYDGGTNTIDIEPCTDIEEIASIDPYTSADYYLYNQSGYTEVLTEPRNETVKNELRYRLQCFPAGEDNIRVKAKFSSYVDGIPEEITTVSTLLAIDLLRAVQVGTHNLKRENLEGHDVMYNDPTLTLQAMADANPVVCSILQLYRELMV